LHRLGLDLALYSTRAVEALGKGVRMAEQTIDNYLKTAEVADLLHVSPKTVTRWAKDGKLPHSRTLGGHRRFPAEAIRRLAEELIQVNNLG